MHQVQSLIANEDVDPELVRETLQELMVHVAGTVHNTDSETLDPEPLVEFASSKLQRRIEIITDTEAELPPVDELVSIEPEQPAASD
jgi:ribonucleoside-diphosphate reductase beta chain